MKGKGKGKGCQGSELWGEALTSILHKAEEERDRRHGESGGSGVAVAQQPKKSLISVIGRLLRKAGKRTVEREH